MRSILLFTLVFKSLITLNAQRPPTRSIPIQLGSDIVYLKIWEGKSSSKTAYVHVHENEEASLAAALEITSSGYDKVVSLSHSLSGSTNRYVSFRHKGKIFKFDPNRIYTTNDQLLINHISTNSNQEADIEVMQEVRNLANAIWKEVSYYDMIIALHNNKNEAQTIKRRWFKLDQLVNESYSIVSYIKRCDHSSESNQSCEEIYINPSMNNSEFFIVTQKGDFDALSKMKQTVVLQNAEPVDDGSMSVWAEKHNKRYINAEAKQGRVEEQRLMLEKLYMIK
jgi:hypothetical protein